MGCGALGMVVTLALAGAAFAGGLSKAHLADALVVVVAGLGMTAVAVWPLRWAVVNAGRALSSVPRALEPGSERQPSSRWQDARKSLLMSRCLVVLSGLWFVLGLAMARSDSSSSVEDMVGPMGVLNALMALLLGGVAAAMYVRARRTMRAEGPAD